MDYRGKSLIINSHPLGTCSSICLEPYGGLRGRAVSYVRYPCIGVRYPCIGVRYPCIAPIDCRLASNR